MGKSQIHLIKQYIASIVTKNQIIVNLVTNILAMSFTMLISLYITPFLIRKLGFAAYGYIGIVGNMVSLMTVLMYTINSMVGRFLAVSMKKDGPNEASKYISSALFTNVFAGTLLLILVSLLCVNLDRIVKIQIGLSNDVKTAFFLSFVALILSSVSIIFSSAAYTGNRLDIINGISVVSNIARVIFLILVFSTFDAHIWYYAVASVLHISIQVVLSALSFKRLLPEVHFDIRLFTPPMALELLYSGFFNAVIMLGNVFITQIDLIVGNRYLTAEVVGMYAAILLIPNSIRNVAVALSSAFSPTTLILYSSGKLDELREYSNRVVKYVGLILGWPLAILSGLAVPIILLWLRKEYSNYEFTIVLMILPLTLHLAVSQLYNVQQAFNKVKVPAFISVVLGISNLVLAIYFVASLKLGIFGIVLSGILMSTVRTLIFIPIYTAFITNQKIFAYYKGLIVPFFISAITCAIGIGMQRYVDMTTLSSLFVSALIISTFYLSVSVGLLLYEEREKFQHRFNSIRLRLSLTNTD